MWLQSGENSINYKNLSVFAEDDFDLMKISLDYYLGIFWGIFLCVLWSGEIWSRSRGSTTPNWYEWVSFSICLDF